MKKRLLALVTGLGVLGASLGDWGIVTAQPVSEEKQTVIYEEQASSWEISQDLLQASADTYQPGNEPGYAVDGDASTFWHTSWDDRKELPQSVTLTLPEATDGVYQLRYTPRQDKDANGIILQYKISVSTDGEQFTDVAAGTWENSRDEKTATFDPRNQVKAVRLTGIATAGNQEGDASLYVSAAEIRLACNPSFSRSKEELERLVEKGEALVEKSQGEDLKLLREYLEEGQAVLEDDLAVQERYDQVIAALQEAVEKKTSVTGYEGARMFATNGELIQAHGGQITKWGDTYYWYGEDKTDGYQPRGVHLYTSKDLYNWEDQGLVLKTMEDIRQMDTDPYFNQLYGALTEEERQEVFRHISFHSSVLERPKVLYNEKTQKYVLWFHADSGDYGKAMAGVAVADKPEGPFQFLQASRLHSSEAFTGSEKGMARDMNVFQDEDGTAYILYASEDNKSLYISRLNEAYTDLDVREGAVEGVDFTRNMPDSWREAPAMFRYQDKYYLMTSGCTGWTPNEAIYYMADTPLGPWKEMGNPCVGNEREVTFRTQSTCIFPVDAKNGKFIYMGDRWTPDDIGDSRYVWLPVEFGYDFTMSLSAKSNWTLEDLEGKSGYTFPEEVIPDLTYQIGDAIDTDDLQGVESYLRAGDGSQIPVTIDWSLEKTVDSEAVGLGSIKGTVTGEKELTVEFPVGWYQKDTVYFVDCNGAENGYYAGFEKEGIALKNASPDQKFDGAWGLVGDPGAYGGDGIFGNGYWAKEGESIVYRFTLPEGTYQAYAGFREWWSENRQAELKVGLIQKDENGHEEYQSLTEPVPMNTTAQDKQTIFETEFALERGSLIEIRVDKVSGGDPLLSWLSIVKEPKDEPSTEPETEPSTEPSAEPETEPSTEPQTEPSTESQPPASEQSQTESPVQERTYRVSYVLNGGKNHPKNSASYKGTLALWNPSRRNYVFAGWYLDKRCKTKASAVKGKDVTLYAKWSKIKLRKPKVSLKKSGKKALKVTIGKVPKAAGYEIRVARNAKMKKGLKIYRVRAARKVLKNRKKNTAYYVRVRAFAKDSAGKLVYGKYSAPKRIFLGKER